jgi:hypothetical protein
MFNLKFILDLFTKGFYNEEDNIILNQIIIESKYKKPNIYVPLVISSSCFLLSGYIAFIYSIWIYFIISLITTFISINHWRDVRKGPRRTADLIGAKISFLVFFLSGCFSIPNNILWTFAVPNCVLMVILYYLSNHFRNQGQKIWIYIHFLFHILVAIEQAVVVYCIGNF